MAEKRVSVRLAAVGGKQVRAELEGVGDAGARSFGRLSSEMERANARLAAFSTRVKIAAAVAVAAAAAAGIAMVRSGLATIDAQANLAQSQRPCFRTHRMGPERLLRLHRAALDHRGVKGPSVQKDHYIVSAGGVAP